MSLNKITRVMPPLVQIRSTIVLLFILMVVRFTCVASYNSKHLQKLSPFSGDQTHKRSASRLFKNFIGDNRYIHACSGRDFFAFESNGSIAWTVHLNYTCNANIAPVHGGSTKIYVVAENRVLKINPLNIGTSGTAVVVFFGPGQGAEETGEIIGVSVSIFSSAVVINIKNKGLFAYKLHGQPLWDAGPVQNQHGYRQGCKNNSTVCYFTSAPVIDHCEASVFIFNTVGELYSISVRRPYFKWIQDLSSFGKSPTVTTGNNGRLYVTVPDAPLVLALDVSTGIILWERSIGPLHSADYEPVVDEYGWISFGSLDGFLYSFSPTGYLRKFPKKASLNSIIQVRPVLDCSGYGVYISQREMEEKAEYISYLKPKNAVFTLLIPATGAIYGSERDPSKLLSRLSRSDLQHFAVDETTLLAFFAVSSKLINRLCSTTFLDRPNSFSFPISGNDDSLPCRTTRQKLASSCSQDKPKSVRLYTGDEKIIILFLLIESVLLVLLAAAVRYCCIFWYKKKLQGLGLGKFLDKRKKAFDRMITELEQETSEEKLEKLGELVKEREGIRRKLSTSYSLGRDGQGQASPSKSLLPLYGGKTRSYSFQDHNKENVTIFHTLSDSCSGSVEYSSPMDEAYDYSLNEDEESPDNAMAEGKRKGKGKAPIQEESSSEDGIARTTSASTELTHPLFLKHSFSEVEERNNDDECRVGSSLGQNRSLRRRAMSFEDRYK